MAHTIRTLTLVGLAAALALPAVSAQSTSSLPASTPSLPALPSTGGIADAGVVGSTVAQVTSALSCQSAVKVHFTWYTGTVTDTRGGDASWVDTREVLDTVTTETPVYKLVHQATSALPSGPVDGAVPAAPGVPAVPALAAPGFTAPHLPVSVPGAPTVPAAPTQDQVVQVLDHVERTTVATERDVDVLLHAVWSQDFVHWVRHDRDLVLGLPAGVPYLSDGKGQLVQDCDGSALAQVPLDVGMCVGACPPQDGWTLRTSTTSASLATPADAALPHGRSLCALCPQGVLKDLQAQVDALGITGTARTILGVAPQTETPSGMTSGGSSSPRLAAESSGITSLTASVGPLAMVGAALAAAGTTLWFVARRRAA